MLHDELGEGELRAASQWAMNVAESARDTEGVTGHLVVAIPRRNGDALEITFVIGSVHLGLDVA